MTLSTTVDAIRDRVDPTPEEQTTLEHTTAELIEKLSDELDSLPVTADVIQTGSTARGTYVTGDRDIDLFIAFPPTVSEQDLEEYGLMLGHAVLPDGREDYASHPYITGTYNGFDIDIVPCYNIDDASNLKSAVDRTPFHTRYLEPQFTDTLASDVRAAKYFLKQLDLYGSNDKTEGFSGYLTELLVLDAGGFVEFLETAADWGSHVFLDIEGHIDNADEWVDGKDGHFFVVDPVDPTRNVADIVSQRQRARLQHHAREFLANPSLDYFTTSTPTRDPYDILMDFNSRDMAAVAVAFDRPDLIDETLIPQLKRSLKGMERLLNMHSFSTHRSDWFHDTDTVVLFAEVTPVERPSIEEHRGPPAVLKPAAENFLDAHPVTESDLYITDDGRYAIEQPVEYRTPTEVLNNELISSAAHGADIEPVLTDSYSVVRVDIANTTSNALVEQFTTEFNDYLHPQL